MDDYKTRSFNKKPTENQIDKQLFSFDVCSTGAKNFIFDTCENIYTIITYKQSNFYEDNTFSNGIKLFVDIDDKIIFDTELERDKYADSLLNTIIQSINNKLFMRKETQINKVKHIYYIIDNMILNNHKSIITKLCSHIDFID